MNGRFEKLAEQASSYASRETTDRDEWQFIRDEKFAELIVGECANAIITESRLNDVRSAANGCVRTIKQHFGVEE